MSAYSIDEKEGTITFSTDKGETVTMNWLQLKEVHNKFVKTIFFVEDVKEEIKERIKCSMLPKEAINNITYINAVNEKYASLRDEHCDFTDDAWTWRDCIDEAFERVNYEDFTQNKHSKLTDYEKDIFLQGYNKGMKEYEGLKKALKDFIDDYIYHEDDVTII